jgi:hypothetical protein
MTVHCDWGRVRPTVTSGGSRAGTGDSSIKLALLSVMLAGIPYRRP